MMDPEFLQKELAKVLERKMFQVNWRDPRCMANLATQMELLRAEMVILIRSLDEIPDNIADIRAEVYEEFIRELEG